MEENIFPRPAVAGVLSKHYVEARLHTDLTEEEVVGPILELQDQLVGNPTTPAYVLLNPGKEVEEKKGLLEGATFDEGKFRAFLLTGVGGGDEEVARQPDAR